MVLPPLSPVEKAIIGLMVAMGLLYGGYWFAEHHNVNKGTKAEVQAQVLGIQADAVQAQAKHTDAEYQALVDAHASDQQKVDTARAEVARLKAAAPIVIVKPGEPPPPEIVLDTAKDALIAQLDTQVKDLKAEKELLIADRDQWKATAELREKQESAQAAATKAWKDAVLQSRWLGRGEGAALGALAGLLIKH